MTPSGCGFLSSTVKDSVPSVNGSSIMPTMILRIELSVNVTVDTPVTMKSVEERGREGGGREGEGEGERERERERE